MSRILIPVMSLILFGMICCPAAGANNLAREHPLAAQIEAVRTGLAASPSARSTGLSRSNYLDTIGGIVRHFAHFQSVDGRILDPFERREKQYSTPCFAWAAASLLQGGRHPELLDPALRALESSFAQQARGDAADRHGDFYTFPAMLAFERLAPRMKKDQRERMEALIRSMDPRKAYSDVLSASRKEVHNWNLVALAGEFLRFQAGFTSSAFHEVYLPKQLAYFTRQGLYQDPNTPMAYDHFPRHFLAVMLHRGYAGESRDRMSELLERGAWTSLLMQSPTGEAPTGGRSAQHQWNEAQQCVTFEIWAARKKAAGDLQAAAAFKRAARLSLESIRRWVRPSGELWIVKNRFDPAVRFGYEGYSFHSQYNLLAASMLATAWLHADDTIPEGPAPAESGGFVFEIPEFHKVFANAGGTYVEIDTAADPNYNSTGLLRMSRTGVNALVGPGDSVPARKGPLACGVAWKEGEIWKSLAGMSSKDLGPVQLESLETSREVVRFRLRHTLLGSKIRLVEETYRIVGSEGKVEVTTRLEGETSAMRIQFPAFVFDGFKASGVVLNGNEVTVTMPGGKQNFRVVSPEGLVLQRAGTLHEMRNGYVESIEAQFPGERATCTLQLTRE